MKLYSVVFVAVIVAWGAGQWGMVDGKTPDDCQAIADAMAKQNKAAYEPCRPVDSDTYEIMKTLHARWATGEDWRIVYACNRKRCREVE